MALIFDIGCNVGNWIKANYNPNDKFIGVDANDVCLKTARKSLPLENVIFARNIISDKVEFGRFYISEGYSEVGTASVKWIGKSRHKVTWDKQDIVLSITLDKLIKWHGVPEYIKIDVEGYELNALRGLTTPVKKIAFEYCEEFKDEALKCVEYLKGLGYEKYNWLHGDCYTYWPSSWLSYEGIVNEINTFVPERMQRWGMIYCEL